VICERKEVSGALVTTAQIAFRFSTIFSRVITIFTLRVVAWIVTYYYRTKN